LSQLLDFLTDLTTDIQKQRAFINTPEVVMDAAGLSNADRIALLSGDNAKIAAPFADEILQITCMEPTPDPMPDPDPAPPEPPPDSESLAHN
jgi:hypothetical protein